MNISIEQMFAIVNSFLEKIVKSKILYSAIDILLEKVYTISNEVRLWTERLIGNS